MALILTIKSPTIKDWLRIMVSRRKSLTNPSQQMWMVLQKVREDIDKQFDEKQGEWTRLAAFTVKKKTEMNADMRILHETHEGKGLRLREAYMDAGAVDPYGKLTFTYPIEKPYAKDLQEGTLGGLPGKPKRGRPTTKKKKKKKTALDKWTEQLDDEYYSRFFR